MIVAISGMTVDQNGELGNAGSGKSTVAKQLVNDHGFVEVSLADPLKRITQEVYDFSDEQLWGPSEARNAPDMRYPREDGEYLTPEYLTPRYALQKLGTEWGRDCYKDTWVELLVRTAKKIASGGYLYDAKSGLRPSIVPATFSGGVRTKTDVVVPDVRLKGELSYLRASGAYLVRVVRPVVELAVPNTHVSEYDLSDVQDTEFDIVIENNEGLLHLQRLVALVVRRLEEHRAPYRDNTALFDGELVKRTL